MKNENKTISCKYESKTAVMPNAINVNKLVVLLAVIAFNPIASAGPYAEFRNSILLIHDKQIINKVKIGTSPFYTPIVHSVKKFQGRYYVLYDITYPSGGAQLGYCGAGIESEVVLITVDAGIIVDTKNGKYESCYLNRITGAKPRGWSNGKFTWSSEGSGNSDSTRHIWTKYTWIYDSNLPKNGISEEIKPSEWQPPEHGQLK